MENPGRKVLKVPKDGQRSKGAESTKSSDDPKSHVKPTDPEETKSGTSHPIGGLQPEQCYLDVIPEAKVLYELERRSPVRTAPKRKAQTAATSTLGARSNTEVRQMSMSSMSSLESGVLLSDEDSSESSQSNDSDEKQNAPRRTQHPFTLQPVKRRRRYYSVGSVIHEIDELMKDFRLTDETYVDIMKLLNAEMYKGLSKVTHHRATVRMFPTYVCSLPDGSECGRYLALDLGGTNFRVLLIDLKGRDQPRVTSKIFLIPKSIMLGSGKCLFDHIANCMYEFLQQEHLLNCGKMPLGFTFSFPCYQMGLASARLVRWTKGFRCSGVENSDVVQLLHEAIQRKGSMDIECIAIINDPVGALMSGAHEYDNCYIGLILGTGTNCCYMEQLDRVELWDRERNGNKQVIVNTEWGAFGDDGALDFIRNVFDRELDKNSLNPTYQQYEKMISGLYMGEIARLVLCELTATGLLFGGRGSDELFTQNAFLTKYISEIESDAPEGDFENTRLVLQELDIPHVTIDDCRHVQHVCWQVSQRSAFLAATAVATVIRHLDLPEVTVAVDGSLYRFHPHFKDLMNKKITQLIKPEQKFQLVLSHDGSGKGAALVAAVANRDKQTAAGRNSGNNTNDRSEQTGDEQRKEENME